jgi:cytochrome P450
MTVNTPALATPRIIPGPKPMPLVSWWGNYMQFMRDPIRFLYELNRDYGSLCGFVQANDYERATMVAFAPEYNQQILSDNVTFHTRPVSMDAGSDSPLGRLGFGLPVMNGEQHKQQRRLVMPAFYKKQIESYHNDMVTITEQILSGWKEGETRNLMHDLQNLTLRIVVKSLFGLDQAVAEPMGRMLEQWMQLNVQTGIVSLDLPFLPLRRLKKLSEHIEQSILTLITEKRANGAQGNDVLSMLIQSQDEDGHQMADNEMLGQINMLFAAGYDTSANGLVWTLFLLSQHPDILRDLVDELEGELHGGAPRIDQLGKLPLLDRVMKESLRILTPTTFNTRISTRDFEMGPYHLAKGSVVIYSNFITHRMPHIYEQPARFMPDRWLSINPSPYEYFPFGTGTRMCIGASFAQMEMKIVLAILLQRYRLNLVPNTRMDRKEIITMTSKYGLPMTLHRQDHNFNRSPIRGNILEMVDLPESSPQYRVWGS